MADLTIMIDPGHGGRDPGAVYPRGKLLPGDARLQEAHLNELLAGRMVEELNALGATALLSRELDLTGNSYVSPGERARRAEKAGADALVSLHVNAYAGPKPRGIRYYVAPDPSGVSPRYAYRARFSESLAAALQTQARRHLSTWMPHTPAGGARLYASDAVRRRGNLSVLAMPTCAAVLVETGFITNPRDRAAWADPLFVETAASAYAAGVMLWGRRFCEAVGRSLGGAE